jgi:hypothetical protein
MPLVPTSTGQSIIAIALVTCGLSAHGCSDSASINPEVELASLTVTTEIATASLKPPFDPTTTDYTVDLSNNTPRVTVGARPAVSGDTVNIDGEVTTSRVIDLGQPVPLESTKLVRIVVSESDTKSRTYTVNLVRAGLAGNNSLQNLAVSVGTLVPRFTPDTLGYTVDVPANEARITVTATKADPNAVISGDLPNEGQAPIPLNGPGTSKIVLINVAAPNGNVRTYRITVKNAARLDNNNLKLLKVNAGVLSPPFTQETQAYRLSLLATDQFVTITATKDDPNAVMSGEITAGAGVVVSVGQGGSRSVSFNVIAPNGASKPYSIAISRAPASR